MTLPPGRLEAALAATWPAAETWRLGPFTIRHSDGGGQRVNAATLEAPTFTNADLDAAAAAMRDRGQPAIFRVRGGEAALDSALAVRGCAAHDPTVFADAPLDTLCLAPIPPVTAFDIWPPLAIMTELWNAGCIGPDRIAVMDRVQGPRTALFGRQADRPAGVGFVAADGDVAMVHALDICASQRQKGLARHLMAHAATWARAQGCTHMAVAVTVANTPARALYAALGMTESARYHYRKAPEAAHG